MELSERIKALRQKHGLSQEKLAEQVGVSRQAVAKWEAGQSAPSTDNLFRLAEVLDTTVDLLLQKEPTSEDSPARQIYQLMKEAKENNIAIFYCYNIVEQCTAFGCNVGFPKHLANCYLTKDTAISPIIILLNMEISFNQNGNIA